MKIAWNPLEIFTEDNEVEADKNRPKTKVTVTPLFPYGEPYERAPHHPKKVHKKDKPFTSPCNNNR